LSSFDQTGTQRQSHRSKQVRPTDPFRTLPERGQRRRCRTPDRTPRRPRGKIGERARDPYSLAWCVRVLSLFLPPPLRASASDQHRCSRSSTLDGRPLAVGGFTIAKGNIVEIDILAYPERLGQLDLAFLDD
jgi:hypothetical protein